MRITINHPQAVDGRPVILDDNGHCIDYGPGIQAIRRRMGLSVAMMADKLNTSPRTVEGWESGKPIPSRVLIKLHHLMP